MATKERLKSWREPVTYVQNGFIKVGVFPIRNHYYEPQFDNRIPDPALAQDRDLPGID